jgi:PAS domain S-box-containing protein
MTFSDGKRGLPDGHIKITKYMSVPIMDNDRIVAVAGVGNKDLPYDDTDLRQLNLFMNSMWDILKRQRAEEEVKKNKLYFERLLNTTPISILVYKLENENLILRYFNNTAVVTLNMEDILIIGKTFEELFPVLDKFPIIEKFKNIAKNGGVFSDPVYKYTCDSIEYIFFINAFQSDVNEVSVLFYDTTEQIKLHSEAQNGRDKFKLIFDNCSDAITILRQSDGIISDVNPAFERYTGYKKEEVAGKTLPELDLWDSEKDNAVFNEIIRKDSLVVDFPADLKLKDGIMEKSLISSIIVYINEEPHVVSIARIYDKNIHT